jgi:hypothetical protein
MALRLSASIIILNVNDLDFEHTNALSSFYEDNLLRKKIHTYQIHRIHVRNKRSLDRDCHLDAIFYVSRE